MNRYFGLALLLCYGWSQSQAVNTMISAVGGNANGQPCVFPFKYKSKWYLDCTSDDGSAGRLWCATTANYDEDKRWGYCTHNLIYTEYGTANGEPCVFPFMYNSWWYSDCISFGTSDGRRWCPTTADYAKDKKWGFCKTNVSYAMGGNANGEPCVFPFKYKSTWYPDCTSYKSSGGRPWCATTSDYDTDGKWGYCTRKLISAVGGKASGEPCVFPFKYNSKWYMDCDGTSDGHLWCATTADYDTDGAWGYCSCKLAFTEGGNGNGMPCVFPFTYKSKSYSDCTGDGGSAALWCATTSNYDTDQKWGYCSCKLIYAVGGTAHGEPCVFPFTYKSKSYSDCTGDDATEGRHWCATTADFDKDNKWGYCTRNLIYAVGGTAKGEPCVFPFKYKSTWYSDCTSDDSSEGRLWCAITSDYDKDKKWGYCTRHLISTVGGNSDGQTCVFPFKYNDKLYSDCTTDGTSCARFWCATTADYNKDQKWGYCSEHDAHNCKTSLPTDDALNSELGIAPEVKTNGTSPTYPPDEVTIDSETN